MTDGWMTRGVFTTTILLTTLALPTAIEAQASGSYSLSGDIVSIYNLVGEVSVSGGPGSSVSVEIDAQGRDADDLTVETGPIGSAETLRVIYPDDRVRYVGNAFRGRTQMRVRDDGTFYDDRGRQRGRRVEISNRGRGLEAHANLTIRIPTGRSVSVYLGVGEVTVSNVEGDLRIDVGAARVESERTRGRLSIDTGSGSVDVRDAEGNVTVDTGSGSVTINDVSGNNLHVDTGSGSVTGSNITVGDLNVDTGSGRITLSSVRTTDAILDTGSGSVQLDLLEDVDNLEIDTGSGNVTVMHTSDFGAQLELESSSGGIEFDAPVTVRRFSRSTLTGTIGDGRGRVHVDTGSGSIRFRLRG